MTAVRSVLNPFRFGGGESLALDLEPGRIVNRHQPAEPIDDFAGQLREQLRSPLDFPPLGHALVPGDRVVVALDRNTPAADVILAELWTVFEQSDIQPEDVTILQPASWRPGSLADPRTALPNSVRKAMGWQVHDATDKKREAFLSNSAEGERIYLCRDVADADFVLPVGCAGFDPLLGFRTAASAIFPGLSNIDAMSKTRGQEQAELRPADERPLRQLQYEVAWLLGVQCGVQVLPGRCGQPAGVLFGAFDSINRQALAWLEQHGLITIRERCETVVLGVDGDGSGSTWEQIGAAVQTGRHLVQRGGRIILLTNLNEPPTEGFGFLRQSQEPRESVKPLRLESPPDVIPATRWALAASWATIYLLSRLSDDALEGLFVTPLANTAEFTRLLASKKSPCLLIEAAEQTVGFIE